MSSIRPVATQAGFTTVSMASIPLLEKLLEKKTLFNSPGVMATRRLAASTWGFVT